MRWDDMPLNLDDLGYILTDSQRKDTRAKQMHCRIVQGVWHLTRTSAQRFVLECIRCQVVVSVNHHGQRSMRLKYTIHRRDAVLDL